MKKIIGFLLLIGLFGVFASKANAAVKMEGDMFFQTSFMLDASNQIATNATGAWVGKNTSLYLGIYPVLTGDNISGRASIYANVTNYREIFFGGAYVTGQTEAGNFKATAFAMKPAFEMSDPMSSGVRYASDVYNLPIAMATGFVNDTNYYPVIYDEAWIDMDTLNYTLGGSRALGGYTSIGLISNMISIEDYALWNLNDFDAYGAMLKLNPLDIGITLEAGLTAEMMKFKSSQDFELYNAYYLYDFNRQLPIQSTYSEDSFVAYGGYAKVGLMDLLDIFAQVKMGQVKAKVNNPDASNAINTIELWSGVYTDLYGLMNLELDFGMKMANPNAIAISNSGSIGDTNTLNGIAVKLKAYSYLDFEMLGMYLKYLVEATFVNFTDTLYKFNQYENISFGGDDFEKFTGIDLKASFDFDFLYMFGLREIVRFNMANFSSPQTYDFTQIESRTYLDIDLEDLTPGLWTTIGARFVSYNISSSISGITAGNASYFTPYAEIKYVFGDDSTSFARLTYGFSDIYSELSQAYGLGYDQIKLQNSSFDTMTDGSLYNVADFELKNNHTINLEVGMRI